MAPADLHGSGDAAGRLPVVGGELVGQARSGPEQPEIGHRVEVFEDQFRPDIGVVDGPGQPPVSGDRSAQASGTVVCAEVAVLAGGLGQRNRRVAEPKPAAVLADQGVSDVAHSSVWLDNNAEDAAES